MRMHTRKRQLSCEWCTEQCLKTYDLEKHMREFMQEKNHSIVVSVPIYFLKPMVGRSI